MGNERKLLELGFTHYPAWDWENVGVKHYRKLCDTGEWRAYVCDDTNPPYITLGKVISGDNKNGVVDRWRQCCSKGSIERKIASPSDLKEGEKDA